MQISRGWVNVVNRSSTIGILFKLLLIETEGRGLDYCVLTPPEARALQFLLLDFGEGVLNWVIPHAMEFSRSMLFVGALVLVLSRLLLLYHHPSSPFPKPLYQALGVSEDASAAELKTAYDQLCAGWSSDGNQLESSSKRPTLLEIHHAYRILSNELSRRSYDIFHLNELPVVAEDANNHHPIDIHVQLQAASSTILLTSQNFNTIVLESNETWVIQVMSNASYECQLFASKWERVAGRLEGVAKLGRVAVEDHPLSTLLAEKSLFTKQLFFKSGLPEVMLFTSKCRRHDCLVRYRGVKTVDALVEWTSSILQLPRIPYYNSQYLMKDIIQGTGPHKVKVIVFSSTGERAAPFIRQCAKESWEHVVFAMVLWQQSNATFWESRVGIKSAPAVVFVKDPGLQPAIHHGVLNSSTFRNLMTEHKLFELPQLRSISIGALGCDARGEAMAGRDMETWYCVIVAGRTGLPLNQARGVMRGVLQNLTNSEITPHADDIPQHLLAAEAMRTKRLSLSWLDGEIQKDFCYFYLHSPTMFEACGPKKYGEVEDVPKLFLVRYQRRFLSPEEEVEQEKQKALLRARNIWMSLQVDSKDVASQLVSKYHGEIEVSHVVVWISQMVYEGDNHRLPSFSGKMPALVPEEKSPFWVRAQDAMADGQPKVVQNGQWLLQRFFSSVKENINLLFMLALIVFGASHLLSHHHHKNVEALSLNDGSSGREAQTPGS